MILLLARLQRSNPIYSTNMSAPAEEPYELFPITEIDTPLIQGKHRSSIREYVQRHMKSVPSLTCPSIFATVFKVFRHSIPSWISFLLAVAFYVLTVLYAWRPELVSRIELFGGSPAKAIRLLAILSGIANSMLTATILHSFDIVHWTLVARLGAIVSQTISHSSLGPG
jgi:hypothetical protein